MNKTLLPPNASELEFALEQVLCRTTELPVNIDSVWHPDTCPVDLLPWLAWAFSVDTWDASWTQDIKRKVINSSFFVHRQKGTPSALKSALGSLGLTISLEEWFHYGGQPHTFRLRANINENVNTGNPVLLNQRFFRTISRIIDNVKPARSHYDLQLSTHFKNTLVLAGASIARQQTQRVLTPQPKLDLSQTYQLVAVARIAATTRSTVTL